MTIPTAAEFKARHARFAAVANATVDAYLAEAALMVDATVWAATDYPAGVMLLAAHYMVEEGALAPTGPAPGVTGALKRAKAGKVEVEYAAQQTGEGSRMDAVYGTTTYGRRFLALLERNALVSGPAVLVV